MCNSSQWDVKPMLVQCYITPALGERLLSFHPLSSPLLSNTHCARHDTVTDIYIGHLFVFQKKKEFLGKKPMMAHWAVIFISSITIRKFSGRPKSYYIYIYIYMWWDVAISVAVVFVLFADVIFTATAAAVAIIVVVFVVWHRYLFFLFPFQCWCYSQHKLGSLC